MLAELLDRRGLGWLFRDGDRQLGVALEHLWFFRFLWRLWERLWWRLWSLSSLNSADWGRVVEHPGFFIR